MRLSLSLSLSLSLLTIAVEARAALGDDFATVYTEENTTGDLIFVGIPGEDAPEPTESDALSRHAHFVSFLTTYYVEFGLNSPSAIPEFSIRGEARGEEDPAAPVRWTQDNEIFLPQVDTLHLQATYRGVSIAGGEVTLGFISKRMALIVAGDGIIPRTAYEADIDAALAAGLQTYASAVPVAQAVCTTLAPTEKQLKVGREPWWDQGPVVYAVPCRDGRIVGVDAVNLAVRWTRDVAARASWTPVNTTVQGICNGKAFPNSSDLCEAWIPAASSTPEFPSAWLNNGIGAIQLDRTSTRLGCRWSMSISRKDKFSWGDPNYPSTWSRLGAESSPHMTPKTPSKTACSRSSSPKRATSRSKSGFRIIGMAA